MWRGASKGVARAPPAPPSHPSGASRSFRRQVRPLTDEMTRYAREDTHYLLYIYDKLRIELAAAGVAATVVWDKSGEVCAQTYRTPPFDAARGAAGC